MGSRRVRLVTCELPSVYHAIKLPEMRTTETWQQHRQNITQFFLLLRVWGYIDSPMVRSIAIALPSLIYMLFAPSVIVYPDAASSQCGRSRFAHILRISCSFMYFSRPPFRCSHHSNSMEWQMSLNQGVNLRAGSLNIAFNPSAET